MDSSFSSSAAKTTECAYTVARRMGGSLVFVDIISHLLQIIWPTRSLESGGSSPRRGRSIWGWWLGYGTSIGRSDTIKILGQTCQACQCCHDYLHLFLISTDIGL